MLQELSLNNATNEQRTMKEKIAIIGASNLQLPLIRKIKEMGFEAHAFAWKANAPGEFEADSFYPISITEKERIFDVCNTLGVSAVCTIASDLAAITVNYVAGRLGLVCNSLESTKLSTNKHMMRQAFEKHGDPSPRSFIISDLNDLDGISINPPYIVKPLDRSGSRGITLVNDPKDLEMAIEVAKKHGFIKKALVEEFVQGDEYSIECVSWNGNHTLLTATKKYTTNAPHFVETAHFEPGITDHDLLDKIQQIVFHALDSLQIKYGASHTEIKISKEKDIIIIEIGGRMGGDFIGSHLVRLSTGIDYLKSVVDCALGQAPDLTPLPHYIAAGVRYIISRNDKEALNRILSTNNKLLVEYEDIPLPTIEITDSSLRNGYFIIASDDPAEIMVHMPQ